MEYWVVIVALSLLSFILLFVTERGDLPKGKEEGEKDEVRDKKQE